MFNNELFSTLMEQTLFLILFIIEMISVNSQQGKVIESRMGQIWDGRGVRHCCELLSRFYSLWVGQLVLVWSRM